MKSSLWRNLFNAFRDFEENPDEGIHQKIFKAAVWCPSLGLNQAEGFNLIRELCDMFLARREVRDREIHEAVRRIYSGGNSFSRRPAWSKFNLPFALEMAAAIPPIFDCEKPTALAPQDVLPRLFRPGELVCQGCLDRHGNPTVATIQPLEKMLPTAEFSPLIVPNPALGYSAINPKENGKVSVHCEANFPEREKRRYLVIESDRKELTLHQKASILTALGHKLRLLIVVYSGGKSLHAWFRVESIPVSAQVEFFDLAHALGGCPAMWSPSQYCRMPGGWRNAAAGIRQPILYFNPEEAV